MNMWLNTHWTLSLWPSLWPSALFSVAGSTACSSWFILRDGVWWVNVCSQWRLTGTVKHSPTAHLFFEHCLPLVAIETSQGYLGISFLSQIVRNRILSWKSWTFLPGVWKEDLRILNLDVKMILWSSQIKHCLDICPNHLNQTKLASKAKYTDMIVSNKKSTVWMSCYPFTFLNNLFHACIIFKAYIASTLKYIYIKF